jgi:hypothetical protein
MNPDPEKLLGRLTPRGADPAMRARVLARVGQELEAGPRRRWRFRGGRLAAASLLLGILSNYWVSGRQEQRLAELYGPQHAPPLREMARPAETPTARWLEQRLAATSRAHDSLPEHIQRIERGLRELEAVWKDERHEPTQDN